MYGLAIDDTKLVRKYLYTMKKNTASRVEDIQERWTFGFMPEELPAYLRAYGFELMEDAGAAEYRGKYLAERKSILKGYEFYRVSMAVKRG